MTFDYIDYFNKLVVLPIVVLIATFLALVAFLLRCKYNRTPVKLAEFIAVCLVIPLMLSVGVSSLNTHLMNEKTEDVVKRTGIITAVHKQILPAKFYYRGDLVTPCFVTIDNMDYYIMTLGNYQLGDEVTVDVLPQSKIILSINSNA